MSIHSIKRPFTKIPVGFYVFSAALIYSIGLHYWLGMDALWDTANYHYFIGWAGVHLMSYHYGAMAQYHTFVNPVMDMANYITFSRSVYLGAAWHSLLFALALYLVYCIAIKVLAIETTVPTYSSLLAIAAIAIGATAAMTVSLFGSFTNEHITAVFVLLALLLAMVGLERPGYMKLWLVTGLVAGLGVGLKLTSTFYILALWLSLACLSAERIKLLSLFTVGLIIGYLVVEAPFMILRWEEYQNPIFPLANNIFHSPYFPAQWKSVGTPFALDKIGLYLTLPVDWLYHGYFVSGNAQVVRDGRFLLAFIGIAAFLLAKLLYKKQSANPQANLLILFFILSWVLWILMFRLYRFLVVLELLSGLVFILGLLDLRLIARQKKWQTVLIIVLAGLFLVKVTVYPPWGRRPWQHEFVSATFPYPVKAGDLVFIADPRLSYLVPTIIRQGANAANFYSQPWITSNRSDNAIDPVAIKLPVNLDHILFILNESRDPRVDSKFFSALTAGRPWTCALIKTNMIWRSWMCKLY